MASVAHQAATEVPGVALVSRSGLLGRLSGLLPGSGAAGAASAEVASGSTAIELHLAVRWPCPVAQVAEETRRHVRSRIEDLTGHVVTRLDIVIDVLADESAGGGRAR